MAQIDPVAERRRLMALYATMSDLELQKVGRNPSELTPWASETLSAEMKNRGLEWPPPSLVKELQKQNEARWTKVLRKYDDQRAAYVDQAGLEATGIETFLASDPGNPASGEPTKVLLMVRGVDFAAASQFLLEREALAGADSATDQLTEDKPPSKPVVLRAYRDITAAMVDKTTLDAAGIECYLYDDNLVRLDWFISNAIGGVKLVVAENTAYEAAQILASTIPISDEGPTRA